MRAALACLAALAAASCHRDPPPSTRPGEIVPIDPAGLARLRTQDAAPPRAQPSLRVLSWTAVIAPDVRARATAAELSEMPRALSRRLEMLDAWSPRAESVTNGVRLSFALSRTTLTSIVREQLVRPGRVALFGQIPCAKLTDVPAIPGLRWVSVDNRYDVPVVDPNVEGVPPLAPMRMLMTLAPLPPPGRWAHGSMRTNAGIERRGFCLRADASLPAPSIRELRATMDPSTLLPMLEVTLDDDGVRAVTIWRQLFRGDAAEALLLVVDDEVMGPVTFTDGDAGPMKIRVVPNSRMGSISPELVGALWRSGPIPLPFTLEESAPPLS